MYFQEFVECIDGKSRYFRGNRVRLYQHIDNYLQQHVSNRTCIYSCMEIDEIWKEVMGFTPEEKVVFQ